MGGLREFLASVWFARILVLLPIGLFVFHPLIGDLFFRPIEKAGAALARKKWLAIVVVMVVPILLRLAFLPLAGVPVPLISDEFSYLLAADTFAHGRITNPPHAMAQFFDTFDELQQPTYMSKYPPVQGLFLALGQLLGQPWIGVLISMALAYGAVLWMLQAWLPPKWALVGVVLLMLQFDFMSYWAEGYWGGFPALLGGALVTGAFPRLVGGSRVSGPHTNESQITGTHISGPRISYAIVMAIGIGILANTRPYEGSILCATVAVALGIWLFGRRARSSQRWPWAAIATVAGILCLVFAFMAYYNWRITGDPLRFPYVAYEQTHDPIPIFVWQKFRTIHFANPQFEYVYDQFLTPDITGRMWDGHWLTVIRVAVNTVRHMLFLGKITVAVGALRVLWFFRDRRARFLFIQALVCTAGFCVSVWIQPHYLAPLLATIFCLVAQSMRHLRRVRFLGRPVGMGLTRLIVLGMVAMLAFRITERVQGARFNGDESGIVRRPEVIAKLNAEPGEHLVLVKYGAHHNADEWVYNRADIDHSKIVWAREIPGVDLEPLLKYFHDRDVWVVEPDVAPPKLTRYR